ncbi:MAG: hypothetical protein ACR2PT_12460 [Endozoicomonas sp.]
MVRSTLFGLLMICPLLSITDSFADKTLKRPIASKSSIPAKKPATASPSKRTSSTGSKTPNRRTASTSTSPKKATSTTPAARKQVLKQSVSVSVAKVIEKVKPVEPEPSLGAYVLEARGFPKVTKLPAVTTGMIWDGSKYSGSVPLRFETLKVDRASLDNPNSSLNKVLTTLDSWALDYQKYGVGSKMQANTAELGERLSTTTGINIRESFDPGNASGIHQVFVARANINGKRQILAISGVTHGTKTSEYKGNIFLEQDRESTYLNTTIAYPESQLSSKYRSIGQIGVVGSASMDSAIRATVKTDKFSTIYVNAENKKIAITLQKYGFKFLSNSSESDSAACNPIH